VSGNDEVSLAQKIKYPLTRIGERTNAKTIHYLNSALNYLEVGRWMRVHGYDVNNRVERREQLFDIVGKEVGEKEVLYLEFGVGAGTATRYWSKLLRNPRSKLHGFDSFEGLPEDWNLRIPKGCFSIAGEVPKIEDTRVQFFKGWFDQTLPVYTVPVHDVLVLVMDADLYSSTSFVLNALKKEIVPGTFVYFDEFNDRYHELLAFDGFIKKTGKNFSLLGKTRALENVLFKCIP
jgi:hypothetical protein